jgi:hypothetical protein
MEHLLSIGSGALREKAFWRATLWAGSVLLSGERGKEFLWRGFLRGERCAKGTILAQQRIAWTLIPRE